MFRRALVATLLVVIVVLSAQPKISSVRAQPVGIVCVAPQSSSTSGCPSSPIVFPPQPIGTRLVVAINIQGSDALNGFRIFVDTNNNVLSPVKADLNVTLLLSPVLMLANCVNGAGSGCSASAGDGPGVVDVSALTLAGLTNPPTTGNLFEIVYQVMGVGTTPLSFLTGSCATGSSVPGLCITITSGGLGPVPETSQPGSYAPGAENPPFLSTTPPATLTVNAAILTSFSVVATDIDGQTVTLAATGLPSGATFTTSGTSTVTGVFSWVPAFGPQTATVTFTATDSAGLTTTAMTVITVLPPSPTIDLQHWTHHLSLAKNANMQTWTLKITNPGPGAVFAQVIIQGTNKFGGSFFIVFSPMLTLPANGSVQITMTQSFTSADVGLRFVFIGSLRWGTSPSLSALIYSGGNTRAGSFTVLP